MSATSKLLRLAGKNDTSLVDLVDPVELTANLPPVRFNWLGGIGEYSCIQLCRDGEQSIAAIRFHDAVRHLYSHLPLVIHSLDSEMLVPAIAEGQLGGISERGHLKTGSSPHAPRVIRLAAHWPTIEIHRVAGVILHEAVHQLLYQRETVDSPVRPYSIAYSPFKMTERAGRLVWHAFWTFAVQIGFLMETTEHWRDARSKAASELFEEFSRLEHCRFSMIEFKAIEDKSELERIDEAMRQLRSLLLEEKRNSGLVTCLNSARVRTKTEFESWASSLMSS